ncbi:Asp-tRNA(Asn)/Glu-tRNA(Gln) amidotransferase subunit GatC [Pajaroellobacter abortibovis]|uniref:Aspartyl/glutamyl-tRNA(Asn/Gln) amidotransferase subunit C n=1 Tax=Pajaroellobacter abortibovis TaxID=1882918 RepID=A0A1L6MXN9_9BACT|nr:Asp-tRNA(Asn)/Glu-tRNA(Gln) amidotransferase subunit GatC [Pajaroellobacter abortibovis]APS00168.1 hypothetical protein BCY86_05345 [Pajaroellobacter abortibovis]
MSRSSLIDAEAIKRLAKLASISLTPEEIKAFENNFDSILGYIDTIETLDTELIPSTWDVSSGGMRLRQDEVKPSLSREEVLSQAPHHNQESFGVPVFMEE